ncbi:hypothetical protein [Rhizobium sp. Nf11,1]|uniref:hypothetical protein n=1 Tax=Rhizobium sp. Nf11,1 TaxID=3404923 RepID=UPI003D35021C
MVDKKTAPERMDHRDLKPTPEEKLIRDALTSAGIHFKTHVLDLDFYLPDYDLFIESKGSQPKPNKSGNTLNQLRRTPNILLVQGYEGTKSFVRLLMSSHPVPSESDEAVARPANVDRYMRSIAEFGEVFVEHKDDMYWLDTLHSYILQLEACHRQAPAATNSEALREALEELLEAEHLDALETTPTKDRITVRLVEAREKARKALATRAQPAEVSPWRDISTAPKDGTEVLLGHPDGSIQIGRWNGSDGWDDGNFDDHFRWPTHWMPLPATPIEGKVA